MKLQWPRFEEGDTISVIARRILDKALEALAKKAGVSAADLVKERFMTADAVVAVLEHRGYTVTREENRLLFSIEGKEIETFVEGGNVAISPVQFLPDEGGTATLVLGWEVFMGTSTLDFGVLATIVELQTELAEVGGAPKWETVELGHRVRKGRDGTWSAAVELK